jgi:hypothetical protein
MIFPQKNILHRFIQIFGYSGPSSGSNGRPITRHRMSKFKYILLDLKETIRSRHILEEEKKKPKTVSSNGLATHSPVAPSKVNSVV